MSESFREPVIKRLSKRFCFMLVLLALSVLVLLLLLGGCSLKVIPEQSPQPSKVSAELTIYLAALKDNEPYLVPVSRRVTVENKKPETILRSAIEELFKTPDKKEERQGLTTAVPSNTRLLNVSINRPFAILDFSKELEQTGGVMRIKELLDQITYTATEIEGVAGVILKINGKQTGTEDYPFTGDGFLFQKLFRPVGEWAEQLSPSRALDNFIVTIGDHQAMWEWMGSGARSFYKRPENIDTGLMEGLGSWRNYQVLEEVIKENKAEVIIGGEQILEGIREPNARYKAIMIKENGRWKWDPWALRSQK